SVRHGGEREVDDRGRPPPVPGNRSCRQGVGRVRLHPGAVVRGSLERDDFSSSRHPALGFWWSMMFSENRLPPPPSRGRAFRHHALTAIRLKIFRRTSGLIASE